MFLFAYGWHTTIFFSRPDNEIQAGKDLLVQKLLTVGEHKECITVTKSMNSASVQQTHVLEHDLLFYVSTIINQHRKAVTYVRQYIGITHNATTIWYT